MERILIGSREQNRGLLDVYLETASNEIKRKIFHFLLEYVEEPQILFNEVNYKKIKDKWGYVYSDQNFLNFLVNKNVFPNNEFIGLDEQVEDMKTIFDLYMEQWLYKNCSMYIEHNQYNEMIIDAMKVAPIMKSYYSSLTLREEITGSFKRILEKNYSIIFKPSQTISYDYGLYVKNDLLYNKDRKIVSVKIPSKLKGYFIGKNGKTIKSLEETYNIKILIE